jgi:hypothetical protein
MDKRVDNGAYGSSSWSKPQMIGEIAIHSHGIKL